MTTEQTGYVIRIRNFDAIPNCGIGKSPSHDHKEIPIGYPYSMGEVSMKFLVA